MQNNSKKNWNSFGFCQISSAINSNIFAREKQKQLEKQKQVEKQDTYCHAKHLRPGSTGDIFLHEKSIKLNVL